MFGPRCMLMHICFVVVYMGQCKSAILLDQFYPYGSSHGDKRVPTNDDGSSPEVPISTSFPYFNQIFRSLYINTNGAISFDKQLSTYTPSPFPLNGGWKIVAPYWCDINTGRGGDIWFYETNDRVILDRATNDVKDVFADQIYFSAAWVFVATWDNVAFYGSSSIGQQKRNTFQCILITNGRQSFAIFLYNKIQWTTGTASGGNSDTGLGGTPAQVGFDAGDGFNFKAISQSRTPDVVKVTDLSNINVPGKFIYRMDTSTVTDGGCNYVFEGYLTIFPRFVTMFGGTELSIGGPCFNTDDTFNIVFEGQDQQLRCEMSTTTNLRCVTPMMNKTGDVITKLLVLRPTQDPAEYLGITTFVNPISMEPHLKPVNSELWRFNQEVSMQWSTLPFEQTTVAIEQFYLKRASDGTPNWISEGYVARQVSNVNHVEFVLTTSGQAVLYRIHPESNETSTSLLPSAWSGILIPNPGLSSPLRDFCENWAIEDDTLNVSLSRNNFAVCPCTLAQARLDITRFSNDPTCRNSGSGNNATTNFCQHNNMISQCFRMVFQGLTGNDNQCCYDNNGDLIETQPRTLGGFAHRFHFMDESSSNVPLLSNIYYDMVPFMYCCAYAKDLSNETDLCEQFLERRPPSNCLGYIPPRLATTFGDPHFVSLDGFKYTFNPVGEFILLQSEDKEMVIQGRMEQFKDDSNNLKQASVLTSIAFKCGNSSDVIEIKLNEIRLCDVLVNGGVIDFRDTTTVDLNGSALISFQRNEHNPLQIWTTVTCKSPAVAINASATTKMMNFYVVFAGNKLRGFVKGLLGNFNGRKDDDLTNAQGTVIPINSSLETIHQQFGLSWTTNASDSLFTYPLGKTHQSFMNPNFRSVFEISEVCSKNSIGICGNDFACQFDFCTTGDEHVAISSREIAKDNQILVQVMVPACGEPTYATNGWWNVTGNIATLVCHTGYKLSSAVSITCSDDGLWEDKVAVCDKIVCSQPTNVTNGWWNVTGNIASLVCHTGYKLSSAVSITCSDDGVWENKVAVCDKIVCSQPTNVTNGWWNVTGNIATLVCNTGYKLASAVSILCSDNGIWEDEVAVCDKIGYKLSHAVSITCSDDGVWINKVDMCDKIICSQPTNVTNGWWNVTGNIATLVCHTGYKLSSDVSITCSDDGVWENKVAVCNKIVCSQPTNVTNGWWNVTGNIATLVCNTGYKLASAVSILCSDNGIWEDDVAVCDKIVCSQPTNVTNGWWNVTGDIATLVCHTGYKLSSAVSITCIDNGIWEDEVAACDKIGYKLSSAVSITCSDDGVWINKVDMCDKIICSQPTNVTNGWWNVTGNIATLVCHTGYKLSSAVSITCSDDGVWENKVAVCNKIVCSQPTNVTNGWWNVTGNIATLVCNTGYKLASAVSILCSDNGIWEDDVAVCDKIVCSQPTNVTNGWWNVTGDIATLVCHTGYKLSSAVSITCIDNGIWEDEVAACDKIGYKLSSAVSITCSDDGVWINKVDMCDKIICSQPTNVTNGWWNVTGIIATLVCHTGYKLASAVSITCSDNGIWEDKVAVCDKIESTSSSPASHKDDRDIFLVLLVPSVSAGFLILVIAIVLIVMLRIRRRSNKYNTNTMWQ